MSDNTTKLLQKLQNGEMTLEECQRELNTAKKACNVHYKVSPKGCISFYGIRRMPISLYYSELNSVLESICTQVDYNQEFKDFLASNAEKLKIDS